MKRKTSLRAYKTIKENGLLSKRRFEVYDWLFRDVTESLPVKFEKAQKQKCNHCGGKGYIEEKQARWEI